MTCGCEELGTGMRLLVCGGRDFNDYDAVLEQIEKLKPSIVIHGDERGADRCADRAAKSLGIPVEPYPANWDKYGKAAGPIRNNQMLAEGQPDLVLAFPGGKGTTNMIKQATAAKVKVEVIVAILKA